MAVLEEPIKGTPLVKNYIGGEWVESKGEIIDVVNPATCEVIGKVPISTKEEIAAAIAAANAAFPEWRQTTPVARARCLFRLKELLEENFMRLGFGALRTSYEAFIIYDLFEEVVMRFDVRVSFGRLKGVKWDESIASEVNTKCELLSRYIEGHLPSNGYIAKPDPQVLLSEIEAFEELRKKLKKLKAK